MGTWHKDVCKVLVVRSGDYTPALRWSYNDLT